MSIENFKNPWAKGGEYYPDWLGGLRKCWGEMSRPPLNSTKRLAN